MSGGEARGARKGERVRVKRYQHKHTDSQIRMDSSERGELTELDVQEAMG